MTEMCPLRGYVGLGCYSGEGCQFIDLYVEQIDDDGNVIEDEEEVLDDAEAEAEVEEAPLPDQPVAPVKPANKVNKVRP